MRRVVLGFTNLGKAKRWSNMPPEDTRLIHTIAGYSGLYLSTVCGCLSGKDGVLVGDQEPGTPP